MNKHIFRTEDGKNHLLTFTLISSLFLLWGFSNGMIDVMDKHFQEELGLTLAQSAWVQFAHYFGYFLMALPAGWVTTKLGYKGGIITGLLLVAVGGFWFIPATHIATFWAFLLGVCIIASGLTFLETIANPYTTVLGSSKYSATRINLAQSVNGIGWIFGPIAGSMFFYAKDAEGNSTGSETLWIPYAGIAVVVLVLAIVFFFARLPDLTDDSEASKVIAKDGEKVSLLKQKHFLWAIAAQFFYVAAQSGIFSFFINYITSQVPPIPAGWGDSFLSKWFEQGANGVTHVSNYGASQLVSVGFVLFLVGRFTGAVILRSVAAHKLLGIYGLINVGLCLVVFAKLGWISVAAVFLSYFFMSIMFPTIFALGIHGLGVKAKKASSFIVMAIMGGAVIPKVMGLVGDHYDISRGFIVPMICFAVVAYYGFSWMKLSKSDYAVNVNTAAGH